jgi:hypothetical protein
MGCATAAAVMAKADAAVCSGQCALPMIAVANIVSTNFGAFISISAFIVHPAVRVRRQRGRAIDCRQIRPVRLNGTDNEARMHVRVHGPVRIQRDAVVRPLRMASGEGEDEAATYRASS